MVRATLSTRPAMLALITAGCFDIVAPRERDPYVGVESLAIHDDALSVQMRIRVYAGTDGAGRPNELSDPTIYLNGSAVDPVEPPRDGMYAYAVTLPLPEPLPDGGALLLTLPPFPAAAASSFVLPVPIVVRRGTAAIQLRRGGDLVIGVALPGATAGFQRAQWSLELTASCGAGAAFAALGAQSWPPTALTVPWSMLQATAPPAFDACLSFVGAFEHTDAGYTTQLATLTQARWRVEIRD
jgi:hypothetical protein